MRSYTKPVGIMEVAAVYGCIIHMYIYRERADVYIYIHIYITILDNAECFIIKWAPLLKVV